MSHSIHTFYQAVSKGQSDCKDLLRDGRFKILITDPFDFAGDKERYARIFLFWGRRGGTQKYTTIEELPAVEEPA